MSTPSLLPVEDRFWQKVTQPGDDPVKSCWIWIGALNSAGYGVINNSREAVAAGAPVALRAHRWAYEMLRTEIPDGLDLDHLCRQRNCVNPWHTEPVTKRENTRRGAILSEDACRRGHVRTKENTYWAQRGTSKAKAHPERMCRTCIAVRKGGSSK